MENSKPVDQPSRETVKVRQGTGPREMVSVLVVSLLGAVAVGALAGLLLFRECATAVMSRLRQEARLSRCRNRRWYDLNAHPGETDVEQSKPFRCGA